MYSCKSEELVGSDNASADRLPGVAQSIKVATAELSVRLDCLNKCEGCSVRS